MKLSLRDLGDTYRYYDIIDFLAILILFSNLIRYLITIEVCEQGCSAMASLGAAPGNMAAIEKLNGVELMVDCLKEHWQQDRVVEAACFGLAKVTQSWPRASS